MSPPARNRGSRVRGGRAVLRGLNAGSASGLGPGVTMTDGHAASTRRSRRPAGADCSMRSVGPRGAGEEGLAHRRSSATSRSAIRAVTHASSAIYSNRGLALRRAPRDRRTLRTRPRWMALRDNHPRTGGRRPGSRALRIRTDRPKQAGRRPRLSTACSRCIPDARRGGRVRPRRRTSTLIGAEAPADPCVAEPVAGGSRGSIERGQSIWGTRSAQRSGSAVSTAATRSVASRDGADGLSNIARPTTTPRPACEPGIVYGGHKIGLALGQVSRAMPRVVTVASVAHGDHRAGVRGGRLRSRVEVEDSSR